VSGWITQPLEGNHIASALKNVLKEKVQFDRRDGLMAPSSTALPFSAMNSTPAASVSFIGSLVGEDLWGSPRQPSSHVMIVVVIVVVVVMMVVMVVVVMVVVVLLGECRERREAKCGAEC
jgi:hypothetical protein